MLTQPASSANPASYTIADAPLSWRHWWIMAVSALGQLVGTAVATVAGVIIPLMAITSTYAHMTSAMQGLIGAADLLGIMVGSTVFGRLSDNYGYLPFFRFCPALILAASLVAIMVPHVWVLVICLFIIGFGIGGEYSLDSDYTSVLMPVKYRMMMLGLVKTGAAFGNILAAGVAFAMTVASRDPYDWPRLMWIVTAIAAVMLASRVYFFESPKWLMEHGRYKEALQAVHKFLGPDVDIDDTSKAEARRKAAAPPRISIAQFCWKYYDKVVLTGIPWACEGLGVYGIGVFIPLLVMALGIEHEAPGDVPIDHVASSVKTTLWISLIILPGFLIGIWLAMKKVKVARLQVLSFWACAVSLTLLLCSYRFHWGTWISLAAFMAFELFLNIGPHLVTYLLPPKVYSVEVRGQGTGIAASMGKAGAVIGVFFVPVLLKWGGGTLVLAVSAAVMALGAVVTSVFSRRVIGAGD